MKRSDAIAIIEREQSKGRFESELDTAIGIALACQKKGVSRQELNDLCPREYYYDFLTWLCMQANAVAVWNNDCCYGLSINRKQIGTLRKLKMAGVYGGTIPKI